MKRKCSSYAGQALVLVCGISGCALSPKEGDWSAEGAGTLTRGDYTIEGYENTFTMQVERAEQHDFAPPGLSITLCDDFLDFPGQETCYSTDSNSYRSNNEFGGYINVGPVDSAGNSLGVVTTSSSGAQCIAYPILSISGTLLSSSSFTFQIEYSSFFEQVNYSGNYDDCRDPAFLTYALVTGTATAE